MISERVMLKFDVEMLSADYADSIDFENPGEVLVS
jgi:hypothetical protein